MQNIYTGQHRCNKKKDRPERDCKMQQAESKEEEENNTAISQITTEKTPESVYELN